MEIYFCGTIQSVHVYLWSPNCGHKSINIYASGTFRGSWEVLCGVDYNAGNQKRKLLSTRCGQSKVLDKGKVATKDLNVPTHSDLAERRGCIRPNAERLCSPEL